MLIKPSTNRRTPKPRKGPAALIGAVTGPVSKASMKAQATPVLGHALTLGGTVVRSFEAFPDFVGPSIFGATAAETTQIHNVLDSLPQQHTSQISNIRMVDTLHNPTPGRITLGRANDFAAFGEIRLAREHLQTPDRLANTLTHEVGHTTDYSEQPFGFLNKHSAHGPYGEGPHITEYAKTNHREDLAESYEEFHRRPDNLREVAPDKYKDLEELNTDSFLESLVDRKEFRETGRYIAEKIGPNRLTRNTIEAAKYGASFAQMGNGILQWAGSAATGDSMAHATGILNTAAGTVFASGMAPMLGIGIQGANQALQRFVKRGQLTPQEVESTIAFPVRPIEAMFGRDKAPILEEHRPAKVLAVATGGALGGAAGSFLGPYAGVLAGHRLAGGLGGTIGMVAGGVLGFLGGSEIGGRIGGALFN